MRFFDPHPGVGGAIVPLPPIMKTIANYLNKKEMSLEEALKECKEAAVLYDQSTNHKHKTEVSVNGNYIRLQLWEGEDKPYHMWKLISFSSEPMTEEEEFLQALKEVDMEVAKQYEKPTPKEIPVVELTKSQKEIVIRYLLEASSKGLFEDCDEFWEGFTNDQIDELYSSYRQATQKFAEQLVEHCLKLVQQ
jgi:hypothetical protein